MINARLPLAAVMLMSACLHCFAYVKIDPPVADGDVTIKSQNAFSLESLTSLESNVVWRGKSLTNTRPGWASNNDFKWSHGKLTNIISVNLYSNASDVSPTQGPTTLAGPAGTTAQTTYLMTESKLGSQFYFDQPGGQRAVFSIHRVIYQWPNGTNWLWTGPECASTNVELLSSLSSIKPIKTTELSAYWRNFYFVYSRPDDSDRPTLTGQTQGPNVQTYQAAYGMNWGDFYSLQTPEYFFAPGFTILLESGYWKNNGRYIQGNIKYQFNKTMTGVIKMFNFGGYGAVDDQSGASINLQFLHNVAMKQ